MASVNNSELGPRLQGELERFNTLLEEHLVDIQKAESLHDDAERMRAIGSMSMSYFNFVNDVDVIGGTPAVGDFVVQGKVHSRAFVQKSSEGKQEEPNKSVLGRILNRFMAD